MSKEERERRIAKEKEKWEKEMEECEKRIAQSEANDDNLNHDNLPF